MPIQTIPVADIGATVGQGLGRGLGTVLGAYGGAEFSKRRLKTALEQANKALQPQEGGRQPDMLEVLSQVAPAFLNVRGGPEILQTALPLVQQSIARRAGTQGVDYDNLGNVVPRARAPAPQGETPSVPMEGEMPASGRARTEAFKPSTATSLQTPLDIEALRARLVAPSREAREAGIDKIAATRLIPREQAAAQYDRDIEQINAPIRAQIDRAERTQALEDRTKVLTEEAINKSLSGEEQSGIQTLRTRMEAKALELVNQNYTPEKAAQIVAEKARNLAIARNAITKMASVPKFFEPTKDYLKGIQDNLSAYKYFNALPEAVEDLKAKVKMGEFGAPSVVFPLNPKIQNVINSLPEKEMVYTTPGVGGISYRKAEKDLEMFSNRLRKSIKENWNADQSLKSLKFSLVNRYPSDGFAYDLVNDMVDKGEIDLTDYQERELSELRKPYQVELGDLAYAALGQGTKGPFSDLLAQKAIGRYRK